MMPVTPASTDTYALNGKYYRVGSLLELDALEQAQLSELAAMFTRLFDDRETIYQRIHAAKSDFDPELMDLYFQYRQLFRDYQHRTEDVRAIIQQRLGGPLPFTFETTGTPPGCRVAAAGPSDYLSLSVGLVGSLTTFTRMVGEARALALAIGDGYVTNDPTVAAFSSAEWRKLGGPFVTTRANAGLLHTDRAVMEAGLQRYLTAMLNDGGVLQSLRSAQKTNYTFPLLALLISPRGTRVVNMRDAEYDQIKGRTSTERQLQLLEDHLADLPDCAYWVLIQPHANLTPPTDGLDKKPEPTKTDAKRGGFLCSLVATTPGRVGSVGFVLEERGDRAHLTPLYSSTVSGLSVPDDELLAVAVRAADRAAPTESADADPAAAPAVR